MEKFDHALTVLTERAVLVSEIHLVIFMMFSYSSFASSVVILDFVSNILSGY